MNNIQEIETVESEREAFQITDLSTLGWAFRKVAEYQAKEREINEYAKAEIDRIKEWQNKELGKVGDSIDFFQSHIERYHFQRLLDDPKAKTLSTPYGKSKSTTRKPMPEKVDEQALLDYIHSSSLKGFVKETVEWGKLKQKLEVFEKKNGEFIILDDEGVVVPGVIVTPEKTTFTLEVPE